MNYNELNAHQRDPFLSFDAGTHTYTVGDRTLTSVTTIVESCFPEIRCRLLGCAQSSLYGSDC